MAFPNLEEEIAYGFTALDEDLYDAAVMDELSLKDLVSRLAGLNERVQSTQAFSKGLLRPRTIALIRSVSSRARILAKNMMNLHRATEDIATKRGNQIADALAKMSLQDNENVSMNTARDADCLHISSSTAKADAVDTLTVPCKGQRSPLLLNTLAWLVENMHNPYPSIAKKAIFAASNRSSIKSVNNSFDTARRRIGWTKFLQKHFSGNRALAVDCAHRVFVDIDPKYPVPDRICQDLLGVKAEAERSHSEMLRAYSCSEEAREVVDAIVTEKNGRLNANMSGTHGSSLSFGKATSRYERACLSGNKSSTQSVRSEGVVTKASIKKRNPSDATAVRRTINPDALSPQPMKMTRKRKMDLNHDTDDPESVTGLPKPSKRRRRRPESSSQLSNRPTTSMSTQHASSLSSVSIPSGTARAQTLEFASLLHDGGVSCMDMSNPTNDPQIGRKRHISQTEDVFAPSRKRQCHASYKDLDVSSAPVASISCLPREIVNPHAGDTSIWGDVIDTAPVAEVDRCDTSPDLPILDPTAASQNRTGDSGLRKVELQAPLTCENRTDEGELNQDVWSMLGTNDFMDLPAIPDIDPDWSKIPAPSLDSSLQSCNSFILPVFSQVDSMSDYSDAYSAGSESTLFDMPVFSLSWLSKEPLHLGNVDTEFLSKFECGIRYDTV